MALISRVLSSSDSVAGVLQKAMYNYTDVLQVPQNRELMLCEAVKWEKNYCIFDFLLHDFELQSAFQWEKAFANQGISLLF